MTTPRLCENCKAPLSEHAPGEEGYVRPGIRFGSNCTNFTDAISREAAAQLTAGRFSKGPAGWMAK